MPSKTSPTSGQAFDLLQDAVQARLSQLQADIAEAARRGAYDRVAGLAKAAQELADLKKDLTAATIPDAAPGRSARRAGSGWRSSRGR